MAYELWDAEHANLLAGFSSEAEALAPVRRAVAERGMAIVGDLALAFEDAEGETHPIAAGEALI